MAAKFSIAARNLMLGTDLNLISNGAFTSDTTGWTASAATLTQVSSGGQSGGYLSVASSGAALGQAYQDITTSVGKIYLLSVYVKNGTSSAGKIQIGKTSDADYYWDSGSITTASDWTLYRKAFIAEETTVRITLETSDATSTESTLFDTVVVDAVERDFAGIFKNSRLVCYSGSRPSTPETSAATYTTLATITLDGTTWAAGGTAGGLNFDVAASGAISKPAADTWTGNAVASGTIGWARLYPNEADDGTTDSDNTRPRVDFVAGTDLVLSTYTATSGQPVAISAATGSQAESA